MTDGISYSSLRGPLETRLLLQGLTMLAELKVPEHLGLVPDSLKALLPKRWAARFRRAWRTSCTHLHHRYPF